MLTRYHNEVLLRETLLKKGCPSNSLPKTSNLNFCPIGYSRYQNKAEDFYVLEYPMGQKFGLKVLGKGAGGEPFFRKVSPSKSP